MPGWVCGSWPHRMDNDVVFKSYQLVPSMARVFIGIYVDGENRTSLSFIRSPLDNLPQRYRPAQLYLGAISRPCPQYLRDYLRYTQSLPPSTFTQILPKLQAQTLAACLIECAPNSCWACAWCPFRPL